MSTSEVMIEECMNNVSKYLSCVTGKQEGDQSQTNQGQKVLLKLSRIRNQDI